MKIWCEIQCHLFLTLQTRSWTSTLFGTVNAIFIFKLLLCHCIQTPTLDAIQIPCAVNYICTWKKCRFCLCYTKINFPSKKYIRFYFNGQCYCVVRFTAVIFEIAVNAISNVAFSHFHVHCFILSGCINQMLYPIITSLINEGGMIRFEIVAMHWDYK